MKPGRILLILISSLAFGAQPSSGLEGKKIYISADMEGLAGSVSSAQLGPGGFEYEKFRVLYTDEVNAAINAAYKAGAAEIVVSDSHGNAQSLLVDRLNQSVQLVRSWPRPLGMMQGLDASFDGVLFIGYHAGATNTAGVRSHTMSSANLTDIKVNGISMSEASFNAAIAGHFNVPVLMISGDNVIAEEATALIGDIETAVVKWAYSFESARTLLPEAAKQLIGEKVTTGIAKIGTAQPYKIDGPITLDVSFQSILPAQTLSYLSTVEQINSRTIRYIAKDMIDASYFLQFLESYSIDLKP